jgi:hypothetical protein
MNGLAVKFSMLGAFVPSVKFKNSLKKAAFILKDLSVTGIQP